MIKRALFIAIMYRRTEQELDGCNNDQTDLLNYVRSLENSCEIRVLSDDPDTIDLPQDVEIFASPTYKNIIDSLHWLSEAHQAWISYSGHGSSIACAPRLRKTEIDGRDETIVPCDWRRSGQITDNVLRKELVDRMSVDSRLTALFDCCHSGTVLDLRFNFFVITKSASDGSDEKGTVDCRIDTPCPSTRACVCMLSGCKDDQTSSDATIAKRFNGAMTFAYLHFAKKNLTLRQLLSEMTAWLKDKEYDQRPQIALGNEAIDIDDEWCPFDRSPSFSNLK